MIDFKGIILNLTKALFPTGRAFNAPVDGILEKKYQGLIDSEDTAYNEALSIFDSILADNDNFTEEDATAWERRLGLIISPGVSLENRKAAILRKYKHPGNIPARQHFLYLEGQLQNAGFDVFVFENIFSPGNVTKPPSDFQPLTVFNQHADFQHGIAQHGGGQYPKIVNHLEQSRDDLFSVGDNLRATFYIGGSPVGEIALVPPEREIEFRKLVLNLKPSHMVAFTFINYIHTPFTYTGTFAGANMGGAGIAVNKTTIYTGDLVSDTILAFDDLTLLPDTSKNFVTGLSNPRDVFLLNDRAYVADAFNDSISVFDINTSNFIEDFGGGNLSNPITLFIEGNRAYVFDSILDEVRVFNIDTLAYIPAENFGSGIINGGIDVFIHEGKGYVTEFSPPSIRVFNVSTGAHIPAETIGIGDLTAPYSVFINEGKVYVTDDDEGLNIDVKVFDLATGTYLSAENFGSGVLSGSTNIFIKENTAYVKDFSDGDVKIFKRT